MELKAEFRVSNLTLHAEFDKVHNISDGGYERGYAAGYEQGRVDFEVATQEKTVSITENGSVEIVPDDGHVLSKVVASVAIASDLDVFFKSGIKSINSEIDSIRDYACYSITTLQSVNLPNVKKIGAQVFRACTQLADVNLPKVTSVGSYSFYTCSKLARADFPVLTYIDVSAFAISAAFATLVLRSATVATLANTNAFTNTPIAKGTGFVYVPDNLVDAYKKATNWSTYAAQIKPLSELEV